MTSPMQLIRYNFLAIKQLDRKILDMFKLVLALSVTLILGACSSKGVNEPKALDVNFIDRIELEEVWSRKVGTGDDELRLQLSPVIRDGKAYTIDVEGRVTVIDLTKGKKLKVIEIGERIGSGLSMDRKHFYVTSLQGELLCFDLKTHKEVWRSKLTSEAVAAPAVNGVLVVVQTIDDKLVAFDANTGKKLWRYDSVAPILSLRGTAKPLVGKNYTIASFANGEVYGLENKSGRPMWKAVIGTPKGRTELERLVDVDGQVVLEGDTLYVVGYQGKLAALNVIDGSEIWSKELSSYSSVALGFGNIYVTTSDGEFLALKKSNGSELWRNEDFMYRRLQKPEVFDQFVLASDFRGFIHVLTVLDGEVVARKRPHSDGVMGDILFDGNKMYVYTRNGKLVAYHLKSSKIAPPKPNWVGRGYYPRGDK